MDDFWTRSRWRLTEISEGRNQKDDQTRLNTHTSCHLFLKSVALFRLFVHSNRCPPCYVSVSKSLQLNLREDAVVPATHHGGGVGGLNTHFSPSRTPAPAHYQKRGQRRSSEGGKTKRWVTFGVCELPSGCTAL